ncbi:MAG: sulfotransferase [Arenicellales bacterium]
MTSPPLKHGFILGIDQRSGTNFLSRLINLHPHCLCSGPIWEDHFLNHSEYLTRYTKNLNEQWDPEWNIKEKTKASAILSAYLGDALTRFLALQSDDVARLNSQIGNNEKPLHLLLSKTPSVNALENFFTLFPDAYLILLIRDGRAVVESGVKSFNWKYETAMHRWRDNAQTILDFKKKCAPHNKKLLVVKYEDLILNEHKSVTNILIFLDLDPTIFNFSHAHSLGIVGSSDIKKEHDKMHWNNVPKYLDFQPLNRFKYWTKFQHARFNWIAGKQMRAFGYPLEGTAPGPLNKLINHFLDVKHTLLSILPKSKTDHE